MGRAQWSGGSDGGATSQLDDHLLAVVGGAPVTHLLQGAGCLSQQHRPLARGGEEGEGKVAAGQQDGSGPLSLAGPGVHLSCEKRERCWSCSLRAHSDAGATPGPGGDSLPQSSHGPGTRVPVLSLVDRREEMDWLASLGYYHWPREGAGSLAPGPMLPLRLLHWDIPAPLTPTCL